jgi:hypothetical protein
LEVLKAVRQLGVPAKLLMHMPETSGDGLSLYAVGEQLGLVRGRDWACTGNYFRKGHALLGEADLVKLYNLSDLYLTTTLGEGWGLGITEALACGCPAAVPLHTACQELAEILNPMLHPTKQAPPRVVGLPLEWNSVVCDLDNSRVRYRVDVKASAQVIADYYHTGEWRERTELTPMAEQWLSWDRIAAKMLRLMRRREGARPLPAIYLEYGGGLGDVLDQLYYRGSYSYLNLLKPGMRAKVAVISHNPFVKELFAWHPKREHIEVVDCGYWHGAEADLECRRKFNLPGPGALNRLPEKPPGDDAVTFYPSPEDKKVLDEVLGDGRPVIALALAAGLPERNIPLPIAKALINDLSDVSPSQNFRLVLTGRTYERHGRGEPRMHDPNTELGQAMARQLGEEAPLDLVDRLSVPGTCALLQASAGLVTCHSALNLLAWHLRKPQLLLYPRSVFERHIAKPDQWAFGIGYPETVHALFEDCLGEIEVRLLVERFMAIIWKQRGLIFGPLKPLRGPTSSTPLAAGATCGR